jgi:nucleoid-associated protein EbfC
MFKGLGDFATLLKQASQIGTRVPQMAAELRQRRTEGSAGGGMVVIEVNGVMEVLRVHIDPQLLQGGDVELVEDLVLTALRQAIQKSKEMHAEMVKELTGGVSLPMLDDLLGGAGQDAGSSSNADKPETA